MKAYKTQLGIYTEAKLYWEFILTMEMVEQYKIWHKAIVEKEIDISE